MLVGFLNLKNVHCLLLFLIILLIQKIYQIFLIIYFYQKIRFIIFNNFLIYNKTYDLKTYIVLP